MPPPVVLAPVLELPVIVEFVIVSVAVNCVLASMPAPNGMLPLPPVMVAESSDSEPWVASTRLSAHVWWIVAPLPLMVSGVVPWLSVPPPAQVSVYVPPGARSMVSPPVLVAATIAARSEPAAPSTVGSAVGEKVDACAGAPTATRAAVASAAPTTSARILRRFRAMTAESYQRSDGCRRVAVRSEDERPSVDHGNALGAQHAVEQSGEPCFEVVASQRVVLAGAVHLRGDDARFAQHLEVVAASRLRDGQTHLVTRDRRVGLIEEAHDLHPDRVAERLEDLDQVEVLPCRMFELADGVHHTTASISSRPLAS